MCAFFSRLFWRSWSWSWNSGLDYKTDSFEHLAPPAAAGSWADPGCSRILLHIVEEEEEEEEEEQEDM